MSYTVHNLGKENIELLLRALDEHSSWAMTPEDITDARKLYQQIKDADAVQLVTED